MPHDPLAPALPTPYYESAKSSRHARMLQRAREKPQISQTGAERIRRQVLADFYPSTPTRQPLGRSALICGESDPTAEGNPESFGCGYAALCAHSPYFFFIIFMFLG